MISCYWRLGENFPSIVTCKVALFSSHELANSVLQEKMSLLQRGHWWCGDAKLLFRKKMPEMKSKRWNQEILVRKTFCLGCFFSVNTFGWRLLNIIVFFLLWVFRCWIHTKCKPLQWLRLSKRKNRSHMHLSYLRSGYADPMAINQKAHVSCVLVYGPKNRAFSKCSTGFVVHAIFCGFHMIWWDTAAYPQCSYEMNWKIWAFF